MRFWSVVDVDVVLFGPVDSMNDSCCKVDVEHEVVEGYPRDPGKVVALYVEEVDLMDG